MTVEEVIAAARALSPDDRARLIASIDPAQDEVVVTDALRDELDRRIALIDSGQMRMLSREEFSGRVDELRSVHK